MLQTHIWSQGHGGLPDRGRGVPEFQRPIQKDSRIFACPQTQFSTSTKEPHQPNDEDTNSLATQRGSFRWHVWVFCRRGESRCLGSCCRQKHHPWGLWHWQFWQRRRKRRYSHQQQRRGRHWVWDFWWRRRRQWRPECNQGKRLGAIGTPYLVRPRWVDAWPLVQRDRWVSERGCRKTQQDVRWL